MMMIRLIALFKKEFIQFFRDKALVLLVIYIFLEVALCGWALFLDVKDLPMVVYDMDKSADSRELLQGFQSTENFKIEYYVNNYENIDELLNSGKAKMALVIPPDFSLKLVQGMQAKIQLLADGSNSQISTTALGYAEQIIRSYSMEVEIKRLGIDKDLESMPVITNNISVLYDPALSYTHYIVLSMVAIAALFIGVLLAAGAVVREKEAGTMEQLMVTPASPTEIIIAKILPMGLVKMVGLGIGVMLAMFVFHVPHSGSLALFFLLSTLIFFTGMGLGVFLATFAKNLQQALLLCFFVLFPLMFLSGTIVPISSMPRYLQWISYLSPLRHYMNIALGIFFKGVGLKVLWMHMLVLGGLGLILFWVSVRRFNKVLI